MAPASDDLGYVCHGAVGYLISVSIAMTTSSLGLAWDVGFIVLSLVASVTRLMLSAVN